MKSNTLLVWKISAFIGMMFLCGCIASVSQTPFPEPSTQFQGIEKLDVCIKLAHFPENFPEDLRKELAENIAQNVNIIIGTVGNECQVSSDPTATTVIISEKLLEVTGWGGLAASCLTLALYPVQTTDFSKTAEFCITIYAPKRNPQDFHLKYETTVFTWLFVLPITPFNLIYRAIEGDQYDYLRQAVSRCLRAYCANKLP